jgi:hypothetical protein
LMARPLLEQPNDGGEFRIRDKPHGKSWKLIGNAFYCTKVLYPIMTYILHTPDTC